MINNNKLSPKQAKKLADKLERITAQLQKVQDTYGAAYAELTGGEQPFLIAFRILDEAIIVAADREEEGEQ
jgi:hypothetical protein